MDIKLQPNTLKSQQLTAVCDIATLSQKVHFSCCRIANFTKSINFFFTNCDLLTNIFNLLVTFEELSFFLVKSQLQIATFGQKQTNQKSNQNNF